MVYVPCSFLRRWFAIGVLIVVASLARAASITLIPDRDATLVSAALTNSLGGANAILAGVTQNGTPNRAVLRFNVAGSIPAGSKILDTHLAVSITQQSVTAPAGMTYVLHRMLRSWGEGTNSPEASPPFFPIGLGLPAHTNDATWTTRFFPGTPWGAPGGLEGTDYSGQVTSAAYIDTTGAFEFERTFEMNADVQFWLDNPSSNFGWMLKAVDEGPYFTARKFASRESADESIAPNLSIDYIAPPHIGAPQMTNGAIQFSFEAEAGGAYLVEARPMLGTNNAWTTVTNFAFQAVPATLTARIPTNGTQRFFRVRVD